MHCELKQLSINNKEEEYHMLQDIDNNEYGFSNEAKGMTYEEYKQWLIKQDDYSRGQNLAKNWIPATTYFLYANGKPVGIGRIRHSSSELLEAKGVGNLGYGIAKSERGKGYGNKLLELLLIECKKLGYESIKLFPYIDNVPTNKVIMKNGGKVIGQLNNEKNIYDVPIK